MIEKGDVIRIVPEQDKYDNCLCRAVSDPDVDNEIDVKILSGAAKGQMRGPWCVTNFIELSALELLALEAE